MNELEQQQFEQMKRLILKKILSKAALERLGRIRLVKPELATQLELYLIQLYQANKIKSTISDEQMKTILETLTEKKDYKIIR